MVGAILNMMKNLVSLTPKQYAFKHKVPYTTVMRWLQQGLIEGAQKHLLPLPFSSHIYLIPSSAPLPLLKPGPKPKADSKALEAT
jgi:hypothetical protein